MSTTKIMSELDKLLKENEEIYYLDGVLNKARVIEDLYNYEPELIALLSNSEVVKKHFLIEINGNKIIKINDLIEVFEMNEYWDDSYTAYENRIGLTSNNKFLSDDTDVVLNFPYKDTVLKASMSKEEREKEDLLPEEPFLNEKIAREEIDTLFDKKILINTTKHDKDGTSETSEFLEDENLILKGNNLLALHTLKDKFSGKIKLIYLDPPYNTGNDSFSYNDNFNHVSWLTFMKSRLEIAYELLSDDGSIWITLDDNEMHYLKVLCDQIFGRNNFVNTISWRHSDNSNNNAEVFSEDFNFILVYSKRDNWKPKFLNDPEKRTHFKNPDNNPKGPWFDGNPVNNPGLRVNLQFDIPGPNGNVIKHPANGWRWSKETMKEKFKTGELRFSEDGTRVIRRTYLKDMEGLPPSTLWNNLNKTGHTRKAKYELKKLFPQTPVTSLFSTPKPELLINYILGLGTDEEDIVLDFFMGSGTTQAVAHKMNRQYIGIEQMDYINTVSVPRLQKVIEGEQGGVSKDVDWQGGGSFVYAELMGKNTGYLKDVLDAESTERLREVFNLMVENADFDFRVDLDEVKESVWRLPLEDQKRTLIKIIDKNQLYYNYSEIDDENVRDLIPDSDYAFNKTFYDNVGDENE